MEENKRILAVKMDEELFDSLKAYVKEQGVTTQKFVNDLVSKELENVRLAQRQSPNESQPRVLTKTEVEKAIDEYIIRNNRVPKQTDYRNENNLPSYKSAARCLEMSPAEYGQQRFEELYESGMVDREPETTPNDQAMNM